MLALEHRPHVPVAKVLFQVLSPIGCIDHLFEAALYWIQDRFIDQGGIYSGHIWSQRIPLPLYSAHVSFRATALHGNLIRSFPILHFPPVMHTKEIRFLSISEAEEHSMNQLPCQMRYRTTHVSLPTLK